MKYVEERENSDREPVREPIRVAVPNKVGSCLIERDTQKKRVEASAQDLTG